MSTDSGEITQLNVDLCRTMLEGGMSVADMASELEISPSTIYRWAETHYPDLLQTVRSQKYQQLIEDYQAIDPTDATPLYLVAALCAKYKVSATILYKVLAEQGIPARRSAAHPRKEIRTRAALELYQEGAAVGDICAALKMSPNTVYRILASQDPPVKLRNRQWESGPVMQEISPGVRALTKPAEPTEKEQQS